MRVLKVSEIVYDLNIPGKLKIVSIVRNDNQLCSVEELLNIKYLICMDINGQAKEVKKNDIVLPEELEHGKFWRETKKSSKDVWHF